MISVRVSKRCGGCSLADRPVVLLGVLVSRLPAVRARLQHHGRALRPPRQHRPQTQRRPQRGLGQWLWIRRARDGVGRRRADDAGRSRGHDHRPHPQVHPCRGRVLHLPAGREWRRMPLEPRLPQLRQVRPSPAPTSSIGSASSSSGAWSPKGLLRPRLPTTATTFSEPTARAIDGLERALGAVGLLDEALSLDLRRPQDYFGRVWSTVFRAEELACHGEEADEAA